MSEHQGPTDETTRVQLTSTIEQVHWTEPMAAKGGRVGLEVLTNRVGNSAEVQIKLRDHNGKTFGAFMDNIYGNAFTAEIQVPSEARSALFADIKLPKHGLSKSSGALLLLPTILVTNAQWSQPKAHRGDVVTLTADVQGAPDGLQGKVTVLEQDEDGVHDLVTEFPVFVQGKKIETQWECAFRDTRHIPTAGENEGLYSPPLFIFAAEVAGVRAESPPLELRDWMELNVKDRDGEPLAGSTYILHLPDGTRRDGILDDEGHSVERDLPPGPIMVEVKKKKENNG